MKNTEKTILYGALAGFTWSIGGAISGYLYGTVQNQLDEMNGRPPSQNPIMNGIIGTVTGAFFMGGLYYGVKLAEAEGKIEELNHEKQVQSQRPVRNIPAAAEEVHTPAPTVAIAPEQAIAQEAKPSTQPSTQWQDYIDQRGTALQQVRR
ncbi:MAG: hypothetical protein EAY76_00835 [Alphaproteobacteria bacterium]|nr:MAG: hypothetical protein EAY76_00835 [Alphaproteobacteria bacterium]TAF76930.1 MAG: hypothetical protein EAZ52_02075 [Alphaproteobacteria bacterium]